MIGYREVLASTLFGWMQNDLGQAHAAYQILEQALAKARNQAEQQTTGPHLAQVARALILLGMESDAADIVREPLELLAQTPDRAPVFHPENVVPLIPLCRWLAGGPTPGAFDDARAILLALDRADDILVLDAGRIVEHGFRAAVVADAHSRFSERRRPGSL